MPETAVGSGFSTVPLGDALAIFGDAVGAHRRLDSEGLAAAAAAAIRALTGREVPVLYARQEHTRLAFTYSAAEPLALGPHLVGRCDAMLTAERWTALTVRTADCLPIAFAGGGAAAIAHAGWRGLAADILGTVVGRMRTEFGVAAADVQAAIGVGIGPCHYRVGKEVVAALSRPEVTGDDWRGDGVVDLSRWTLGRLRALGVPERAIRALPGCTACSRSYHSYRRDGPHAGRQWSAVLLTPRARASDSRDRSLPVHP